MNCTVLTFNKREGYFLGTRTRNLYKTCKDAMFLTIMDYFHDKAYLMLNNVVLIKIL